jgi:arsenate reductase (thioredoxin)
MLRTWLLLVGDYLFTVIFACVHNAGRSQMAAAFFSVLADPSKARAISAGTEPGTRIHPEVLTAMQEAGIDLSNAQPQKLTETMAAEADLLVTMGCGEKCPYVPRLRREDWPLEDPKGLPMKQVKAIRDEVQARVQALIAQEHLGLHVDTIEDLDRPRKLRLT